MYVYGVVVLVVLRYPQILKYTHPLIKNEKEKRKKGKRKKKDVFYMMCTPENKMRGVVYHVPCMQGLQQDLYR